MILRLNKYHLIALAVLSGLLLSLAWPARGWAGFAFIALIPLFVVDYFVSQNPQRFSRGVMVLYAYITFMVFNLLTTWWVINSTLVGALLAFILNSFFMALVYGLFHIIKNRVFSPKVGYFSLIFFWIAYEYLHMHWNLSWSWLVFGNAFASSHKWVQWYEYTGVFGGSLWVILVNVILYLALMEVLAQKRLNRKSLFKLSTALLVIIIPILLSYQMYINYQEEGVTAEVVIVQPNIDPFDEQYSTPPEVLVEHFINLAESQLSTNTQLVVGPESALPRKKWEDRFYHYDVIDSIQDFVRKYPQMSLLIGASTYRRAVEGEAIMTGARQFLDDSSEFYYAHNTALMFTQNNPIQIYHKSILVPGVEQMPFPKLMKPLEKFAINLGGTTGSLGKSKTQHCFNTAQRNIKIAPVICYESIYGEFVGNFVRNKANLIAVITNDGWWGNTPGHRQHFLFSVLRSIETRRSLARSANTGISAFINQRGDVFQKTQYWEPAVIVQNLNMNDELTYYVKNGDYIARISVLVSALVLLLSFTQGFLRNRRNNS